MQKELFFPGEMSIRLFRYSVGNRARAGNYQGFFKI